MVSAALCLGIGQVQAAVYSVTEVASPDKYEQHYAMGLNESGQMVGVARGGYNFQFLMEDYITEENSYFRSTCFISDEEVSTGELDISSQDCLKTQLSRYTNISRNITSNHFGNFPNYQKIGDIVSFVFDNNEVEFFNLVDVHNDTLNGLTRSTVEELNAINDSGVSVGTVTAPYSSFLFQQTGDDASESPILLFSREYEKRAVVVKNGETTQLTPEFSDYGGKSFATDITNSGFVAGAESITIHSSTQTDIDSCDTAIVPENVCAWQLFQTRSAFPLRAVVWQLDENNQVVDKVQYPLSFTPSDSQNSIYSTFALAVNENNVAVGYGDVPITSSETSVTNRYPMIFENGVSREILADHDTYPGGIALDINNNNLVTGTLNTFFDNTHNEEFFVYNMESGSLERPTTFYSTAASSGNAVNDSGIVVGEAEYEVTTSNIRRKHGFVYDTNTGQFNDLNDLIECTSVYEIVSTQDINNNGQIAATAFKTVDSRNARGEVILDSEGEPETQQVLVGVILDVIPGGEKDDCSSTAEPDYERKGFSSGILTSLLLGTLVAIRRRFI